MSVKSDSVSANDFLKALVVGAKANQTFEQVCEKLGVSDKTEIGKLRNRMNSLKKKMKEEKREDLLARITLRDGRGRKAGSGKVMDFSVVDNILSELDELDNQPENIELISPSPETLEA